jgi:hypothetical protein
VESFLGHTDDEDPVLARELRQLDAEGIVSLGGVLGRFDERRSADLDALERLLARRVLGRLRRPTAQCLVLTNKILDYLDLNQSTLLEEKEIRLCVEIFEAFARAESKDGKLSERALRMVYAVLRHLDADDDHALNGSERRKLFDALAEPAKFLERQRRENPLLQELLAS